MGVKPDSAASVVLDGLAARYGGTAEVLIAISRLLAVHPDVRRLSVVVTANTVPALELVGEPHLQVVKVSASGPGGLLRRVAWEATRLPRLLHEEDADVLVTFSGMLPRHPRRPIVSELSNSVPVQQRRGLSNRMRRAAIGRTGRHAQVIHAPSSSQAALLRPLVGNGVRVVPHGIDHTRFHPGDSLGSGLLCVADFYEHKRHDLLIDAWSRLPRPRPSLQLIGDPATDPQLYERVLAQARRFDPAGESLSISPRRPQAELPNVYRSARVLVLPSERESFALPLAEAMACGVPAVVRDTDVLREVGGSGALYVMGDEPEAWATAIVRLLDDSDIFGHTRSAALREAQRFSWAHSVEEIVSVALGRSLPALDVANA